MQIGGLSDFQELSFVFIPPFSWDIGSVLCVIRNDEICYKWDQECSTQRLCLGIWLPHTRSGILYYTDRIKNIKNKIKEMLYTGQKQEIKMTLTSSKIENDQRNKDHLMIRIWIEKQQFFTKFTWIRLPIFEILLQELPATTYIKYEIEFQPNFAGLV